MSRPTLIKIVGLLALAFILLWIPQFASTFWEQTGLFAMSAAIGAIGLTLLFGVTGQLSLAHAFFVAVGAYGYCYFAGQSSTFGTIHTAGGLGLPPIIAAILAVMLAGLAGAAFSPIAGRLKGLYLGLASLGLVFVGQHILQNASAITGGFNGHDTPTFGLFGFHFANDHPDNLSVFGVPYGQLERLWYLGLILVVVSMWFARNLLKHRPGRALEAIRDSETAAAVMGVNVPVYRAAAFTVSSAYAGLAGVLLALAYGHIVPDSFDFVYSITFLVMIVVGGLGSVGGAVVGAVLVTLLPQVLQHYAGTGIFSWVGQPGSSGLQANDAANFVYGAAVILVLIFASGGLAGLARGFRFNRKPTDGRMA